MISMEKILLVEDNIQMQKYVSDFLSDQGFKTKILTDYDNFLLEVGDFSPNLILLDVNLPKYDGFFYLKLLKKNFNIPIIILSARSDESEQIRGIENGAIDYITKPFSINVLLAKINALFLRTSENIVFFNHDLKLEPTQLKVVYKNKEVELTKNEFKIISLLVKNKNEIVNRNILLEHLWDDTDFVDDNTLTVNISRLKKKLQEIDLNDVIESKRGVGYIFIYN